MKKKTKTKRVEKIDPYEVIKAGIMIAEKNLEHRIRQMGPFETLSHVAFVGLAKKCISQKTK